MPCCNIGAPKLLCFFCLRHRMAGCPQHRKSLSLFFTETSKFLHGKMNSCMIQFSCSFIKVMENTWRIISSAYFNDRFCQRFIAFLGQILLPQDYPLWMLLCKLFYPNQKIFCAEWPVCHTQNIRHRDNRSEQAAGLHRQCLYTWFRDCGCHQFQTAHRPALRLSPFRCISFHGPRSRWIHLQIPWLLQFSRCHFEIRHSLWTIR